MEEVRGGDETTAWVKEWTDANKRFKKVFRS
jgi:hypothetical protein